MYPNIRITWVNRTTGETIALDPEDGQSYCPYESDAWNLAHAKDYADNLAECRDMDLSEWETVVELY